MSCLAMSINLIPQYKKDYEVHLIRNEGTFLDQKEIQSIRFVERRSSPDRSKLAKALTQPQTTMLHLISSCSIATYIQRGDKLKSCDSIPASSLVQKTNKA